jgi:membrane-associated phospholipid phosphatase
VRALPPNSARRVTPSASHTEPAGTDGTPTLRHDPVMRGTWREESSRLDVAVYAAIAATPTPTLDRAFRRLSRAADHSALWFGNAALLAAAGGERGRRAAANGIVSIALTSAVVNGLLKPLSARGRPDRETHEVPVARHVTMPRSTSFPSGHAASAFAFAAGVAAADPGAGIPLHAAAALVAYSRVHTGVHYPADVVAGAITGGALTPVAVTLLNRTRHPPRAVSLRRLTGAFR